MYTDSQNLFGVYGVGLMGNSLSACIHPLHVSKSAASNVQSHSITGTVCISRQEQPVITKCGTDTGHLIEKRHTFLYRSFLWQTFLKSLALDILHSLEPKKQCKRE